MNNPFATALETTVSTLVDRQGLEIHFCDLQKVGSSYDGIGYCFPDTKKGLVDRIVLPKMDISKFSEEQKKYYNAWLYHELRHKMKSDKKAVEQADKRGMMIKDLLNYLDDARIEINQDERSKGCDEDLLFYRLEQGKEIAEELPYAHRNRWAWIMQAYKYRLPGYNEIPIPEDMKKDFDIGWEILHKDDRFNKTCEKGKEGCLDLLMLAIEIHDAWQIKRDKEIEENEDKTVESESHEENDNNDNQDNSDNSGNSSSDPDSGIPDQQTKSNQQSEGNSETGNNKSPEEKSNTQQSSELPESKSDRNLDRETESANSNKTSEGEEHSSEGPEQSPEKSDRGQNFDNKPLSKPVSIDKEYEDAQGNPESNVNTNPLGQKIASFSEDENQINSWDDKEEDPMGDHLRKTPNFSGDPYIPYAKEDSEIKPEINKENKENFLKISNDISLQAIAMRKTLSRILATKSLEVTERGVKRGQLDPSQFYKIPAGGRNVKKHTTPGIKIDTAVTLLVDLSGSMSGSKAKLAVKMAILFGEALKGISKIKLEILGYNSEPLTAKGNDQAKRCGYTRKEKINYWIFKEFNEPWAIVKERLGACSIVLQKGGAVGGCNCDHENLIHAASRLYKRREENKVMIVLCDGAPSGHNGTYNGKLITELKNTVKKIKHYGISLFCFGIQAKKVEQFYAPDVEIVNSLNDLDQKALKKLGHFLLTKRKKKRI